MDILPCNNNTKQRAEEDRAGSRERARARRERLRTITHCVKCNKKLTGIQRKYCSDECRPRRLENSVNYNKQCSEPDCDRPTLARGLCPTHYSKWRRANKASHYTKICGICGDNYTTPDRDSTTCSKQCAAAAGGRANAQRNAVPTLFDADSAKQCKNCNQTFLGSGIYCGESCRGTVAERRAQARWSPMRKAFEQQDGPAMIVAIEQHVSKTHSGCWEWKRRIRRGYAIQSIGNKSYFVHRLSLEAKMGAPLGSQAAHHMCANTKCVNPDHLQPVTHRENIAEMLARNAYLARIAELESALAGVDPGNPLLRTVPVM